MERPRTVAQRSRMRKIGQETSKTTKSNANMLAIAGETSPTSLASSSGPSTNNILPMLNPIEVEDESMVEGSEDELATPTITTAPTTTTTTTTDEEPATKKRTVEQLFARKPTTPRLVTQASAAEQKERALHLVAQGVKAFQDALSVNANDKLNAAIRELLAHAAAVQEGRLLCSYTATQELAKDVKALQLQLSNQAKAKANVQPQPQP